LLKNREQFVTIARIAKTQGRCGEVAADLLTDFPERFAQRKRVLLTGEQERQQFEIEDWWRHKDRIVLKFANVNSISEAEELVGREVQIPQSERVQLEEGAFYISDLVGCEVWDYAAKPQKIGSVESVEFGAGSAPLLNVADENQQHQIPFAVAYVKEINTAAKRLNLQLPAGLLEINQPLTEDEKRLQRRKRQDEV
jgi:16S rRNA processing protein RimM